MGGLVEMARKEQIPSRISLAVTRLLGYSARQRQLYTLPDKNVTKTCEDLAEVANCREHWPI